MTDYSMIESLIPNLILDMKVDQRVIRYTDCREFFVLKDRNQLPTAGDVDNGFRFVYFESEHLDLSEKLSALVGHGCIASTSSDEVVPVYRWSDDFIRYLSTLD